MTESPEKDDNQWSKDRQKKDEFNERAKRYRVLNAALSQESAQTSHPRETDFAKLITRQEAVTLLQVKANEFSVLVRTGVIRESHVDLPSLFIYRDVAELAQTVPGSEERKLKCKAMRLKNTLNYLSDFAPWGYFSSAGEPLPMLDMDYADRAAEEAYQEGLANLSVKFRSLTRPLPRSEDRDSKTDRMCQFLYMHDDAMLKMMTALEMRRWFQEAHPHTQFQVSRISLPPLEALNRPEHQNVLKFLVRAASVLFNIDFEVMPTHFYESITQHDLEVAMKSEEDPGRLTSYETLTGARVSDDTELRQLLSSRDSTTMLPLRHAVTAWYRAYQTLVKDPGPKSDSQFQIKNPAYIKELIKDLSKVAKHSAAGMEPEALVYLRRQVEVQVGCQAGWAEKYREVAPPTYVGQPPCHVIPHHVETDSDPLRVDLHPALRTSHVTPVAAYLMEQNCLAGEDFSHMAAARRVVKATEAFHREVVKLLPEKARAKRDKFFVSQLFKLLKDAGINPRSLYLHPHRDAGILEKGVFDNEGENLLLTDILPTLANAQRMPGLDARADKMDSDDAEEQALTPDPEEEEVGELTPEVRLKYVLAYVVEKLNYTAVDIAGMEPEEMLNGLGEIATESLDLYILQTMAEEDEADGNIINLDR